MVGRELTEVEKLHIGVRAANVLHCEGIKTLEQLDSLLGLPEKELLRIPGMGKTSLAKIR